MEVHHHPHVEKKSFKEYLLEGLMIFLAVSMGFIAENIREHMTDAHREKEFVKQLYVELKEDSATINLRLTDRMEKEKYLQYLSVYFQDSSLTNIPKNFYPMFTMALYAINRYAFEPKDGILSQLRNSGSASYLKNVELQKLLGDLNVSINNMRYRNEQEYQYFASPIKAFLLTHFDFKWLNDLRNEDTDPKIAEVMKRYMNSDTHDFGRVLHPESIDRSETSNMLLFFRQMLLSTQTLQFNVYMSANYKTLQTLRREYQLDKE